MTAKEPASVAILAARLQRAYPSLSPYSCASLAGELESIERAQRRHAERCCSGEDGGYTKQTAVRGRGIPAIVHDDAKQERAAQRVVRRGLAWRDRLNKLLADTDAARRPSVAKGSSVLLPVTSIVFQGDPRGAVLLLRLPGEAEGVAI